MIIGLGLRCFSLGIEFIAFRRRWMTGRMGFLLYFSRKSLYIIDWSTRSLLFIQDFFVIDFPFGFWTKCQIFALLFLLEILFPLIFSHVFLLILLPLFLFRLWLLLIPLQLILWYRYSSLTFLKQLQIRIPLTLLLTETRHRYRYSSILIIMLNIRMIS